MELKLDIEGGVNSDHYSSVDKYIKDEFNVEIDNSVNYNIDRSVVDKVCRGVEIFPITR